MNRPAMIDAIGMAMFAQMLFGDREDDAAEAERLANLASKVVHDLEEDDRETQSRVDWFIGGMKD